MTNMIKQGLYSTQARYLAQQTKQLSLFASTSFLHKAAAPVRSHCWEHLKCMQRLDALSDDFVQKKQAIGAY